MKVKSQGQGKDLRIRIEGGKDVREVIGIKHNDKWIDF